MKFKIVHESRGRIRVQVIQNRMTLEQADLLEAYLCTWPAAQQVTVHERTCCAVVRYEGDRQKLLTFLSRFSYTSTEIAKLAPTHTGRALNREYQEKLVMKIVSKALRSALLPAPLATAYTLYRSVPYLVKGIQCLWKRKLHVELLDALSIGISMARRDFSTAGSVMFLLNLGSLLEEWTRKKSLDDLARSMALNVDKVWVRSQGTEVLVPLTKVRSGDEVVVRSGNMIPLDGTVLEGRASVDQSALTGESVPVASLVEVADTVGVEYVSQFNLYRSVSLTVTPAARASTTTVMQEITATAAAVLPDDIGTAWSGTSYQEANASKTGGLVYALALVFVFLALAALYESWGLPLAILMSVPVAVLGAVLFVGGTHLMNALYVNDIYMQISLVMLIGLAAKNAILVVEYADRLFREQGASLMDAAIGAAKLRVRPIIMTAFAFILGVMPLVFASGVYATARNIMGVALVGGMLFATLLGIFVYPALYYFVGKIGRFEQRRERQKTEEAQ